LRAVGRVDALGAWTTDIHRRLFSLATPTLSACVERVSEAVQRIEAYAEQAARSGREFQEAGARAFSFAIGRTEAAALLVEHAAAIGDDVATIAATRWCSRDLASLVGADAYHRAGSTLLGGGDHQT